MVTAPNRNHPPQGTVDASSGTPEVILSLQAAALALLSARIACVMGQVVIDVRAPGDAITQQYRSMLLHRLRASVICPGWTCL